MGKEKKEGMKYPKIFLEMCSGLYMKLYTKKIQLKLRRYRYFDFFLPLGKVHTKVGSLVNSERGPHHSTNKRVWPNTRHTNDP